MKLDDELRDLNLDDELTDLDLSGSPAPVEKPVAKVEKPAPAKQTKAERAAAKEKERDAAKKEKAKEAEKAEREEKAKLDAAERRIKTALSKSGASAVEIGEELARIKKEIKPGTFRKWTESNLKMTYKTVSNYVRSAQAVAELRTLVTDKDKLDAIYALPPTILYAFPSYDNDAKKEVAEMIDRGEVVKAKPRKTADEGSKDDPAEGDEPAEVKSAAETVKANDPDTDAAKELANDIVSALDANTCKQLQNHPGFNSVMLHTILKKAFIGFGKF